MKYGFRNFSSLKKGEDICDYLCERPFKHSNYCHYTSLKVVDEILKNNEFWVSSVSHLNDLKDREQYSTNYKKYYSLCFSTGVNENLSLWYLYSGLNGHGGRIRLSANKIQRIIENSDFYLYEHDYNALHPHHTNNGVQIILDKDFTYQFKDMLYSKKVTGKNCSLKYNTMTNYNLTNEEFEKFSTLYAGFIKGLIWYYEKETRLLITLNDELISKLKDKEYIVVMKPIDKISKYIKIELGPEIEDIYTSLSDFPSIKKFLEDSSKVKLSDYNGTIQMNFCEKCDKFKKVI